MGLPFPLASPFDCVLGQPLRSAQGAVGLLAQCALWPGPEGRKNPYFNMGLADRHKRAADVMLMDAMRQDEEVFMQNVRYQQVSGLPLAPDAAWSQKHAVSI